jgi:hypothetical protein
MKKQFVICFCLVTVANFFVVSFFKKFDKPTDVYISPNNKYKVELWEDKTQPFLPFETNIVTAKMVVADKYEYSTPIHYADWMDTSFDKTYFYFDWEKENILRIGNTKLVSEGDSVTVTNNSSKKIRFLRFGYALNEYLVFELEPKSKITVYNRYSTGDEYIYVDGEFEDGGKIPTNNVNFSEKAKRGVKNLFQFCISIDNTKSLINSTEIEGYQTDPKVIIPKVENCSTLEIK